MTQTSNKHNKEISDNHPKLWEQQIPKPKTNKKISDNLRNLREE